MEAASANLTPVCLELGGKDAAILCEDADLSQAVPIIMRGTFQNCGQNCIGLERIIIHEKIYEDFISRVQPLVERLTQGPPLTGQMFDAGATVMATQASRLLKLFQLLNFPI